MRCDDCQGLLSAFVDSELPVEEMREVREHIAGCGDCRHEHDVLVQTVQQLREGETLPRYTAPDVLKARIRGALGQPHPFATGEQPRRPGWPGVPWRPLAAAAVVIAIASSALTLVATRAGDSSRLATDEMLASHIRSLMPGHLTDVASTNQHNVKPWFNGRIGLAPSVPSLDSAGFSLTGGRLDYVDGHPAAVVVYTRRQHIINVYSWPVTDRGAQAPRSFTDKGFNVVRWTAGGIESWAISDLNRNELADFVRAFTASP